MNNNNISELANIAKNIIVARDNGMPDDEFIAQLRQKVKFPGAESLCDTDLPKQTIAEVWQGIDETQRDLTREELLALVRRIRGNIPITESESLLMDYAFDYNCRHPAKNGLIYYPKDYFDGRDDPTSEEIVDKAILGY